VSRPSEICMVASFIITFKNFMNSSEYALANAFNDFLWASNGSTSAINSMIGIRSSYFSCILMS